jgi:hypothetical protein
MKTMTAEREMGQRHRFENGLTVMFEEYEGRTQVTVELKGAVQQFVSTSGPLSSNDWDLVVRILGEEGLDLFAAGTTKMVQRLRGAGVRLLRPYVCRRSDPRARPWRTPTAYPSL